MTVWIPLGSIRTTDDHVEGPVKTIVDYVEGSIRISVRLCYMFDNNQCLIMFGFERTNVLA